MSKKVNTQNTQNTQKVATTATENTTVSLKELFEQYPNASLRKLAAVTGVNYGVLLTTSKKPITGEAYDPNAINWAALEAKFVAKGVDLLSLEWDALNEGPNRKGATLQKTVDAFNVGDKVYLRRDNTVPYEILYKTKTHIVIMKVGTSEPQAWANNTFLINGPVFEPRTQKVTAEVEEA